MENNPADKIIGDAIQALTKLKTVFTTTPTKLTSSEPVNGPITWFGNSLPGEFIAKIRIRKKDRKHTDALSWEIVLPRKYAEHKEMVYASFIGMPRGTLVVLTRGPDSDLVSPFVAALMENSVDENQESTHRQLMFHHVSTRAGWVHGSVKLLSFHVDTEIETTSVRGMTVKDTTFIIVPETIMRQKA